MNRFKVLLYATDTGRVKNAVDMTLCIRYVSCYNFQLDSSTLKNGKVAEWSNAPDSKSGIRLYRIVGSNPTLTANHQFTVVHNRSYPNVLKEIFAVLTFGEVHQKSLISARNRGKNKGTFLFSKFLASIYYGQSRQTSHIHTNQGRQARRKGVYIVR